MAAFCIRETGTLPQLGSLLTHHVPFLNTIWKQNTRKTFVWLLRELKQKDRIFHGTGSLLVKSGIKPLLENILTYYRYV